MRIICLGNLISETNGLKIHIISDSKNWYIINKKQIIKIEKKVIKLFQSLNSF